ncbi:MAG TPA: S1C family serine protease [Polyangiaceae bacterium]|nr:S1C family serine protease [Polyangiaceae bacterium]
MSSLIGISQAVSELVRKVQGAIVSVGSRHAASASGIAWEKDLVVTAAHAIERDDKVSVVSSEGNCLEAECIGTFLPADLALLRVKGGELPAWERTARAELELGELVLALGRSGQRLRAKVGLVSFLGAEWRLGPGVRVDRYIESDIAPCPAFSAGALVRADGTLIGVNSARFGRGALVTLPTATVERVVAALSERGRVRRAELGVAVHPVQLPSTLGQRLGQSAGLIVMAVRPDSPAERSGLMLGDVLLRLGDAVLGGVEELENALGEGSIGQSLPLLLVRAGERLELRTEPREKA